MKVHKLIPPGRLVTLLHHCLTFDLQEEDIHHLRVEIKKHKAQWKTLNIRDTSHKPQIMLIKSLFSQLGKLRELQVQSGIINQYTHQINTNFPLIDEYLIEGKDTQKEKVKKAILVFDEWFDAKTYMKELYDAFRGSQPVTRGKNHTSLSTKDHLRKWVLGSYKILKRHTQDEEKLHNLRKKIKNTLYTLKREYQAKHQEEYKPALKTLSVNGEKLGQWHDLTETAHLIEKVIEEHPQEIQSTHSKYHILKAQFAQKAQEIIEETSKQLMLHKHELFRVV